MAKDDFTHISDFIITKNKLSNSVEQLHDFGIHVVENKVTEIMLMGESKYADLETFDEPGVEYLMANKFITNMLIAMRSNPNAPIIIHMKTCGGSWKEGMAIHNIIKACPNNVTILNYTHARSMSSLIFQAADKRIMMPDSEFMFHFGEETNSAFQMGQHEEQTRIVKKSFERMLDIYVERMKQNGKHSKKSPVKIKQWIKDEMNKKVDAFFDAEETVQHGLADEVFGKNGKYDWASLTRYDYE